MIPRMISMVLPLSVGNALRVFVQPPANALYWRILRKQTNDFTGQADANAKLIFEGVLKSVLDDDLLENGATYFYAVYYWDGIAWSTAPTQAAVPAATYRDGSTDALEVVLKRLTAGLAVEVARGALVPESGALMVYSAPPAWENIRWPLGTVHLTNETPGQRAIGETFDADEMDDVSGVISGSEGWLSKVQLTIALWSQNPDERIELRKALRRVLIANLPVFDANGMIQVEFSMQDIDMVSGEYPANVYQVMCNFTCSAPARVISDGTPLLDVATSFVEG